MKAPLLVFAFLLSSCLFAQQAPVDSLAKPSSDPVVADPVPAPAALPAVATPASRPDSVKIFRRAEKLIATFDTVQNILEEGEIFSKNLRVVSNIDERLSFKLDVSFPAEWKTLVNKDKTFYIDGHDTMYIPVRLVPLGKIRGNTKYVINAYLFDTLGAPVTSTYVLASRPKLTKWSLNIGPNRKVYFKNDSNQARFSISLGNEGTEPIDLYMTLGNYRKDLIIMDTNGVFIKRPNRSVNLNQFADTVFYYGVKIFSAARNKKRIDTEGYIPGYMNESRTYSIFAKSTETNLLGANARQQYQKIDFVQLPNVRRLTEYGMYSLPVLMDFTLSNLFSQEPTASLFLRGSTGLNNGGTIMYSFQAVGAFGVLGSSSFPPPFFTLGYYDYRLSVLVGDVGGSGGGIGIGGKGINSTYRINKRNKIGAFFVVNPGFLRQFNYYGTGANYNYTGDQFNGGLAYSHIQYGVNTGAYQFTYDYLSAFGGFSFLKHNSITLSVISDRVANQGIAREGLNGNLGYGGSFIKTKLTTNINVGYYSKYYSFYDMGNRITVNHNSFYRLNAKWSLRMTDIYNQYATPEPLQNLIYYRQTSFSNILSAGRALDIYSSVNAGVFYNIFQDDYYLYTSHSRGIQFNYNYTFPEDYFIFGTSAQFGYNKIVSQTNSPDDFFLNINTVIKYRVYSLLVRYTDGSPNGAYFVNSSQQLYSEDFSASLNHQYQFRNRHFILNNSLTYNLLPEADRTSWGITPELNYYTRDGWRIRVTAGYYYSKSLPVGYNPYQVLVPTTSTSTTDNSQTPVISDSYVLMLGVRKEFGIPLPFIKKRFPSLNFIAFADVNGNGKFDLDETRLENVVINVNGWEVLTNSKGQASLKNLPEGEYVWQSFSLEDIQGYFPNINDRIKVFATTEDTTYKKFNPDGKLIPVPYVKGIKLFGKIYLDREKLSPDAINLLDLSGIRVSVNCSGKKSSCLTDKDGSFMLYLPYGKYIVSMDEKILGDRFRLMQNDIEVELNKGIENLFVSFYIVENKRKINRKRFDSNGNLIQEGAAPGAAADAQTAGNKPNGTGANATGAQTGNNTGATGANGANPNAGHDLVAEANAVASKVRPRPGYDVSKDAFLADKTDATTTKGLIYTIQLGAFQKPLQPNFFKGFKNVMYERIDNEMVRITAGNMKTEAEALSERDNMQKVGFPGAFVAVYYDGKHISLTEAKQISSRPK